MLIEHKNEMNVFITILERQKQDLWDVIKIKIRWIILSILPIIIQFSIDFLKLNNILQKLNNKIIVLEFIAHLKHKLDNGHFKWFI